MAPQITKRVGASTTELRDSRYDAVLHLVTAAEGAEEFYTVENNAARSEGIEQAQELDRAVLRCWNGAPDHVVVSNPSEGGFDQKINNAITEVCKVIGVPVPEGTRRYFSLKQAPPPEAIEDAAHFFLELDYLDGPADLHSRVQRRTAIAAVGSAEDAAVAAASSGGSFFSRRERALVQSADATARRERRRQLSGREYTAMLAHARNPDWRTVSRWRRCFTHRSHVFELDVLLTPTAHAGTCKVAVECQDPEQRIEFPPSLEAYVDRDVTDVVDYRSSTWAGVGALEWFPASR